MAEQERESSGVEHRVVPLVQGVKRAGWLRDLLETLIPALFIALLIHLFLAQATRVYGQSMEPSLHSEQRLVVEKVSYRFHTPRRGDIVVLRLPGLDSEPIIKRVIGLPGEQVEIYGGKVYIDGKPLEEPYLREPTKGYYGPRLIPPLHIFVLGDNRDASNDSRAFGPVPLENVVGRAWLSYWPLEDLGFVH
jgi:signal peptidase I